MNDKTLTTKAGYVAIIGQPNVGKSTLINALLGKKLSITSSKPQTTRHRILGIKTIGDVQLMYVDTPGMHIGEKKQLNRYMNRVAKAALHDVDVIVFVIDAKRWNQQDDLVVKLLTQVSIPVILAVNKIDMLDQFADVLPVLEKLSGKFDFHKMIPISAKNHTQLDELETEVVACLPSDVHYFSPEEFTDRSDRFITSEMVREKLIRSLGQEIPYELTVTIEALEEQDDVIKLSAIIWIEKDSQKSIVIGTKGEKLKAVGIAARKDMERYFDQQVFLKLWVKVKSGWSDNAQSLENLGYD